MMHLLCAAALCCANAPLDEAPKSFSQSVPGTALSVDMVGIQGKGSIKPFLMSRTEVPWELFDVYVYQLDQKEAPANPKADAVARPTKPYISMDRGFGHAGWPAISMSAHNARTFCEWLSAKTGRTYRLPTVEEWKLAAERAGMAADQIGDFAWTQENAEGTTRKVGTRKADKAGLHDLYGNAAEWVLDAEGNAFIIGGCYRDAAARVGPGNQKANNEDWNASDPQFPKSIWWLADGGFIGLRVVCEPGPADGAAPPSAPAAPGAEAKPPAAKDAPAPKSAPPAGDAPASKDAPSSPKPTGSTSTLPPAASRDPASS